MSAPKEFKFEAVCLTLEKASSCEERPYQCQQGQILSRKNVPEKLYFIKKNFFLREEKGGGRKKAGQRVEGRGREGKRPKEIYTQREMGVGSVMSKATQQARQDAQAAAVALLTPQVPPSSFPSRLRR